MKKCGRLSFYILLKDFLWIRLENTWLIKRLYPLYRRILKKDAGMK